MQNILSLVLFILALKVAHQDALPRRLDTRDTYSDETAKQAADNCLVNSESVENCQSELNDSQLSSKVVLCLNGCAECVKQWQAGVYNGRSCALDCVQQNENLLELPVDPDCNLVRYFNTTLLSSMGSTSLPA